jgi:hypothetical protein
MAARLSMPEAWLCIDQPRWRAMTDLTKPSSSYNPWISGFPLLSPPATPDGSRTRAPIRGSWLIALRCRLRRNAVDRELAVGADPDSSECRHRRASELTGDSNRKALADAYERHIVAATSFPPLDVVPVNWSGVRAATPRLDRLAQRLREDPGVRAQGVARARLLLTDGDSVLYAKDDDMGLVDEVRSTLALL